MGTFKAIKPENLKESPFKIIGSDWMLIAAGDAEAFNMMTASWGGFGVLWHKNICFCVVRPGRHTFRFMEKSKVFSLSFFDKRHKPALELCGTKSGRDINKVRESGLTPVEDRTGAIYFKEARLAVILKKIYYHDIDPGHFLDSSIGKNYPEKDYHRMYVGEIVRCIKR